MPNSIVPIHHIFVEWYKEILATFLIAFGIVYKFGKQEEKINSISSEVEEQGEEINETQDLIENFQGICDALNSLLQNVVTVAALKIHCKESQQNCTGSMCKKFEEIKNGQLRTDKKVEENRTTVTKHLTRIEHFMGAIEERNKMIDAERARRGFDK